MVCTIYIDLTLGWGTSNFNSIDTVTFEKTSAVPPEKTAFIYLLSIFLHLCICQLLAS